MTFSGTLANLNGALNGLIYAPNSGYSGSDSLQISVNNATDNLSGSARVAITINAVAPPSVTAPATASLRENSTFAFAGTAISLTDAFASATSDSLTLWVTSGKLSLGSTGGLAFSSGASNSSSMTVSGTLANLTAAVNGLVYTPTTGFSGHDSLQISLADANDKLSGPAAVAIAVNPHVTAPATASVIENGTLAFSSSANDPITLADGGAAGTSDSLTLTVLHGKLTLASATGLTFTAGSNGSASMTVQGTLANLLAALNGLVYTPVPGYTGPDTLSISLTDSIDELAGSASVAITVSPKGIHL